MKSDYGDLLLLFEKLDLLDLWIPMDPEVSDKLILLPKNKIRVFGRTFSFKYENRAENLFVLNLKGKTVYFHYYLGGYGEKYLKRVSIPCFG